MTEQKSAPRRGIVSRFPLADRLQRQDRLAYMVRSSIELRTLSDSTPRVVFSDKPFEAANQHRGLSVSCPLAWTPDGTTLFHSHDQILAIDVMTGQARAVTRFPEGEFGSVRWQLRTYPDGRSLLFLCGPGLLSGRARPLRICTVPTAGGVVQDLFAFPDESNISLCSFDVCWSEGFLIALADGPAGSSLWRVDLNNGNHRLLYESDDIRNVSIEPSGDRVLFEHRGGIDVSDTATGAVRELVSAGRFPSWSPDGTMIAYMAGDAEVSLVSDGGSGLPSVISVEKATGSSGSFAQQPLWSRDGQLLWFSVTGNPEEARSGGRGNGHFVGVADFGNATMWLADGYWSGVAWAPM